MFLFNQQSGGLDAYSYADECADILDAVANSPEQWLEFVCLMWGH